MILLTRFFKNYYSILIPLINKYYQYFNTLTILNLLM